MRFSPVSFEDVDQFSEWEIGLGWNIESTQLSRGANEIGFDHFVLPELLVGHFHAKQAMENVFEVPEGVVVFVICRTKLPLIWSGRELLPSMLGIVRSGLNHSTALPAGLDCYEFMMAESMIRRTDLFPPDFFEQTARFEKAYLPLPEPQTGRFLEAMDAFFRRARAANGAVADAVDGAEFYEYVIEGLQRVVDGGLAVDGPGAPRLVRRPDIVPQAREFMAANLRKNLTADEIAESLGVSYRALHYAFRESLGVSPYQYYLTQRLHQARRRLKSGGVSVSEASMALRFYTMSRFARQYRRLFGELPSETSTNGS